jgi:uncharacterized cupredoxin-like copper-binding protein
MDPMRPARRTFLVVAGGTLASLTILASGCAAVGLAGAPDVVVQVRQSIDTLTFTPDHAKVGQHVRFHVEATDDFSHQFEADGTPFKDIDVVKGKARDLDWTPDKPGTFQFTCDNPGHKEKATFTVEP